jgi:hypothetical protein
MKRRGYSIVCASLLIGIAQGAIAASVTFGFGGRLVQVGGPNGLAVGDGFTGSFSYTLGQTGTDIALVIPGEVTRYALDSYSVTIGGQRATSIGGTISIANDNLPFQNYPNVVWDRVDLDPGPDAGGIVSGSINGFPASDFQFSLVNLGGQPFSDTSLPGNLALSDFPALRQMQVMFANGGGAVFGEVTSLELIPEPGAGALLGLAGVALVARLRNRGAILKH